MRSSRSRLLAVAFVAAATGVLVACSLTTDLSGFSNGARDREAGAEADAATDATIDVVNANDATTGTDAADSGTVDASSPYAAAVLADDPILYYRLGETDTSAPALDSSKALRHASFKGNVICGVPGAIADDANTACRFDGTSAAVFLANPPTFAGASRPPYSLEAWARPTDFAGPNGHVVAACEEEPDDGYAMFFYLDGKMRWERETATGTDGVQSSAVVGSTYRHLVGTYDGSTLRVYVDGVLSGSLPSIKPIPGASNVPFSIGANSSADTNRFVGDIDEVALYDHVLTPEQIRHHHDVGVGLSGN